ncbi:hypothetical protein B0H67DRAFT_548236 [Lasiosphaeris hirsuta]|uniref:Uncharacterized protein n=1 Tax=Lasiosphaeris hirsuta TaxID=260670 RepID=A0AA40B9Q8_9PEZI|nr:hypothetical protein B0H67DRAFT_548236 [Lasiosphaeris hirsuta]
MLIKTTFEIPRDPSDIYVGCRGNPIQKPGAMRAMPAGVNRIASRVKEINTLPESPLYILISESGVVHVYACIENGHFDSLRGPPPESGEDGLFDYVYVDKPQIDTVNRRVGLMMEMSTPLARAEGETPTQFTLLISVAARPSCVASNGS